MIDVKLASRAADGVLFRSAEHHHFQLRGRWYLFDVNAFTVLDSGPLDGDLLRWAREGTTADALVERAVAGGVARRRVAARSAVLLEERFLLPPGEEPRPAHLRAAARQVTFMVNVAQRCNLTCPYCYVNEGLFDYERKPIARMGSATAGELVERLHGLFPGFTDYTYHFYGGEPLLNFAGIREIVERAKARARETGTNAHFHITSNGTLLDRDTADFMDEHHFTVIFSIDGDKERHDDLRKYHDGRGSFDDVAENLAYLRTRKGVHLVCSAVIREGLPLSDAFGLLEKYGAHAIKAEHTRLTHDDPLYLDPEALDEHLEDLASTLVDHYVEELSHDRKPRDPRLFSKLLGLLTRTRRAFFCTAAEHIYGIAANGEIYPCALHVGREQSKLGHVETGVDPERVRAFRRKFGWLAQEDCQTCFTRHLCGGGCSAMVDRFGHEDCQVLRAETEAAIAIYAHFLEHDPAALYGVASAEVVRFIRGRVDDAACADEDLVEPSVDAVEQTAT